MDAVSVTEIRNALRCPRLFALTKANEAAAFPVGSSSLGALFHRIAARLPEMLAMLKNKPIDAKAPEAIIDALIGVLIAELREHPELADGPNEVDDLAEAIRQLSCHLAERVRTLGTWNVVEQAEMALEGTLGEGPEIRGRIDALFLGPDNTREVVEYKLTDESNLEFDRAQVALYRALLLKSNIDAQPVVMRFLPDLREIKMAKNEADLLVKSELLPMLAKMDHWQQNAHDAPKTTRSDLCAKCPAKAPCDQIAQTSETPSGGDDQSDAVELRDMILAVVKKQGVAADCKQMSVGPRQIRIELAKTHGSVKALDSKMKDIEHQLSDHEARYIVDNGHRYVFVKRTNPQAVYLDALCAQKRSFLAEKPGRFVVGKTIEGDVATGDLSDASCCHLLVGGQSGSGKSVWLQSMLLSLIAHHPPSAIRFVLADPKIVTFNVPKFITRIADYLEGAVRYDIEEIIPVIEQLVAEMERRYRQFQQQKVQNIDEYNAEAATKIERRVLVIDEFQDLMVDKESSELFVGGIKRLGAKARAAGIHLILATQRPDAKTLSPQIKANLVGRVAFRVGSHTNSKIILDASGAEDLLGKGDLLASFGLGRVRAQGPIW
jgi:S-DNA-T family DNA segregation ATPase FtsK/SpoIIIE